MQGFKKLLLQTSGVVLSIAIALAMSTGLGTAAEMAPKKITFVSGGVGGTWYNAAATLSQILMKDIPGLQVTATSGTAIGNVRLVDGARDAQLAWTYLAFVHEAMNAQGQFKKKLTNIAVLLPGMLGSPYLIATKKSGIKDWSDLKKGKRLLTFRPGGIQEMLTREILGLYGISYGDIRQAGGSVNFVQFNQAVSLIKDGRADATMVPGGPVSPVAGVLELESTMEIVFPTIRKDVVEKFSERHPGFIPWELPVGLYKSIKTPVGLPAGLNTLIVPKSLPADFVYKLAKAVYEHRGDLQAIAKAYNYIQKENLARGIPDNLFHPGALRYIKEVQGK